MSSSKYSSKFKVQNAKLRGFIIKKFFKKTSNTFNFKPLTLNLSSGITFIEIILIVALMLIISTMSPIFYSRFLLQNAVSNTADQLTGSLRKAQLYAMMSKRSGDWSVNFSSNTVTLYKGTTFAGHDTSYDEKFSVNPNVFISGMTTISYTKKTGLPTPTTSTITITSPGNNSETITVNNQGGVSR